MIQRDGPEPGTDCSGGGAGGMLCFGLGRCVLARSPCDVRGATAAHGAVRRWQRRGAANRQRVGVSMTAVDSAKSVKQPAVSTALPQDVPTFQDAIAALQKYWADKGCIVWHPYNHEVGAGTMNPATYLRVLGPEPWSVAYDEPSVRPDDSRYGENPNRVQRHTQFQVILKPAPENCQELLLGSYQALGIDTAAHDVRFVEDNWESPALGAWGLGWEVWLDGMEVTQFTYFQQAGGFTCDPVALEITYGLERIMMSLQRKNHFKDIVFSRGITYGDIFMQNEVEMSKYNMDEASVDRNAVLFDTYEKEGLAMIERRLPVPAYNYLLKASHTFNILDARGAIGVTERAAYFRRMRNLAREAAQLWYERREELGFPLLPADEGSPEAAAATEPAAAAVAWSEMPERATFLLEIGTEELPAEDVDIAAAQLKGHLADALEAATLSYGAVTVYATPRRTVAVVDELASRQPDLVEELKGPPKKIAVDDKGELTKAATGFCRKNGVDPSTVEWRELKGQEYLFATVEKRGRHTGDLLAEVLPSIVRKIGFIKTMRWNSSGWSFSRPIRWASALLEGDVVEFEVAGVSSGRTSYGLRAAGGSAPEIVLESAAGYVDQLRSHDIVLDVAERRSSIRAEALEAAAEVGGTIADEWIGVDDGSLLAEVANLVEAPSPVLGRYDDSYLKLPTAVLTTVMKKHQRYFPVADQSSGELLPAFVTITNGPTDYATVQKGNEDVLRARLSDASFFYDKDRQRSLLDFKPALSGLVFQVKLGSMLDKCSRVEQVCEQVARLIGATEGQVAVATRAAALYKCDLATNMVVEFTSLAGEMGRHYAAADGEEPEVAEAIFESVLPRSFGDAVPESEAGSALAIADRLDSLVGLFAAGCGPTANTDVFALRRTAVGLVSILMARGFALNLREGVEVLSAVQPIPVDAETKDTVVDFIIKRMESSLLERRLRVDLVRSVIMERGESPSEVVSALEELISLVGTTQFDVAMEVYGRPSRLIKSKGGIDDQADVDEDLFETDIESGLYAAYVAAAARVEEEGRSVRSVVEALESMQKPVDDFFETVFVMAEDEGVRANRLLLCAKIAALPRGVLDLTQIQ